MKLKTCIAANWKMNLNIQEAEHLLHEIANSSINTKTNQIVICVPFPYLTLACSILNPVGIAVGAQDCSAQSAGAFTGEVSASMIKSCGAEFVILGHSERRKQHNETAGYLVQKIKQALEARLHIIFCVGESEHEREQNNQYNVVTQQLTDVWPLLQQGSQSQCIIAYEPVWAIGTGKSATPQMAQEMHAHIKAFLAKQLALTAESLSIRVLYGGSCTPDNAVSLFNMPDIDGALVGGASLKSQSFIDIVNAH